MTDTAPRPGVRCYVWVKEDETYAGTLEEFARSCEVAHYHSVTVGPLYGLTVDGDRPVLVPIDMRRETSQDDDYAHVILRTNTDVAFYKIDLRA